MWRFLENPMHGSSRNEVALAVHLPDGQPVIFEEGREEEALRRAGARNTTLTAWFSPNAQSERARTINYQDMPNHYTLTASNSWKDRVQGGDKAIGRIVSVSPRNVELYHLRLLLLRVLGAESFPHLRTV